MKNCAEMEAENIDDLVPIYLKHCVSQSKDNSQHYLTRHGSKLMRNVENDVSTEFSRLIKKVMKNTYQKISDIPHEYEDWMLK